MNRQAIHSALFTLVSSVPGLVTASPKLKHWSDVGPSEQPALFLSQGPQTPSAPPANGAPRAWHLEYTIRLYVRTEGATDPTSVLNPLLDAIASLFDPVGGVPQTLGGTVQWARIEGTIETFEGTLGDQEVALVPIKILTV